MPKANWKSACVAALLWMNVSAAVGAEAAADLTPEMKEAFQAYVSAMESQMGERDEDSASFLPVVADAGMMKRLRAGEVLINSVRRDGWEVPHALLHDWEGSLFIPGTTPSELVSLLLDYDRHEKIYPEVLESRLLSKEEGQVRSFLRLRKKKVITVVLDTEHEVRVHNVSSKRVHIRSHSTKISEVDKAGSPDERTLPEGQGHGFMWNLNAYWWIEAVDDGVVVQCRAISLSRDIPWALRWIVKPFVTDIPRESLMNTLTFTRDALVGANR